jgi:hypothetical protein
VDPDPDSAFQVISDQVPDPDTDPALQKMKFMNCFLFFWAIFAPLDPDPIRIKVSTMFRIQIRMDLYRTDWFDSPGSGSKSNEIGKIK